MLVYTSVFSPKTSVKHLNLPSSQDAEYYLNSIIENNIFTQWISVIFLVACSWEGCLTKKSHQCWQLLLLRLFALIHGEYRIFLIKKILTYEGKKKRVKDFFF